MGECCVLISGVWVIRRRAGQEEVREEMTEQGR